MTEKEYQSLIDTYGITTTKQLIEQLSLYKQTKKANYKNDYANILYWVTERLRELEKRMQIIKSLRRKKLKSQRLKPISNRGNIPLIFLTFYIAIKIKNFV